MALISIRALSTVFGPRPRDGLALARAGLDRRALLARGHTLALLDVDLDIQAGEIFVVMGLSGSGKSTLVRHINRLVEPTEGAIFIDGQDILGLPAARVVQLRRRRISMVFQAFGLLPHRNVIENVALGLELGGVEPARRRAEAMRWVERVGLAGFEHHRPRELSGGMRQRVGLARAFATGTDIILMDEAFSALDPLLRDQMQLELLALQAELGRTVVFVTHDLDEALRIGSRIAILRDGRVAQVGTPQELLLAPADPGVAAFARDVNRARALRVGSAISPWPQGLPPPAIESAADAEATVESVLPRLIGRDAPLAVQRDGRIIGRVSLESLRELLAARG